MKRGLQHSTYIESRVPSSACNPYLVTAATLVAGIDGILKQTILPEACKEPFNPKAGRKGREEVEDPLPESLEEALVALEEDEVMKEGLGKELVRWFVDLKKQEINIFEGLEGEERFEKEREMYLEII